VPTNISRKAYCIGIVAKQGQNSGSLTKTIDRLEWMREQMLSLQRALERVESNKRGQQIQRPTTSWNLSPHFGHSIRSKNQLASINDRLPFVRASPQRYTPAPRLSGGRVCSALSKQQVAPIRREGHLNALNDSG
jgi:hypothetical protein